MRQNRNNTNEWKKRRLKILNDEMTPVLIKTMLQVTQQLHG